MDNIVTIIKGGAHSDNRGTITFINDFDMQAVRRFYRIKHPDTTTVRGWRGHKIEQRWFHVSAGTFLVKLIKIDDWLTPNPSSPIEELTLSELDFTVLHIPAGFATAIQALEENAELTVFADYPIDHAKHDDYLFPQDYFKANS